MQPFDATTALIVVDVQNDFADPAGTLSVAGGAAIIPVLNELITCARDAGATVAYTQDWHPESTPHFAKDGGIWPVHCVQDTWGATLHEALTVDGPIVRKGANGEDGYSGFTMRDPLSSQTVPTDLAMVLHDRAIERVVIGGLATDYCVRATAIDAVGLGFETIVLTDAIAAVDVSGGDGERALADMASAGVELATAGAIIEAVDDEDGDVDDLEDAADEPSAETVV